MYVPNTSLEFNTHRKNRENFKETNVFIIPKKKKKNYGVFINKIDST